MKLLAEVEKQFTGLRRHYNKRKKLAESCVSQWHWATSSTWNLNPLYFEMHGWRSGRRLNKKPASNKDKVCFGIDEEGRVVVERKHNYFGCSQTFYDWSRNPVEVACFDYTPPKGPVSQGSFI